MHGALFDRMREGMQRASQYARDSFMLPPRQLQASGAGNLCIARQGWKSEGRRGKPGYAFWVDDACKCPGTFPVHCPMERVAGGGWERGARRCENGTPPFTLQQSGHTHPSKITPHVESGSQTPCVSHHNLAPSEDPSRCSPGGEREAEAGGQCGDRGGVLRDGGPQ